jgi:hypothetical protein
MLTQHKVLGLESGVWAKFLSEEVMQSRKPEVLGSKRAVSLELN